MLLNSTEALATQVLVHAALELSPGVITLESHPALQKAVSGTRTDGQLCLFCVQESASSGSKAKQGVQKLLSKAASQLCVGAGPIAQATGSAGYCTHHTARHD